MAHRRRQAMLERRRQRQIKLLCFLGGIAAVLLSVVLCLFIFDLGPETAQTSAPVSTPLPYDADTPFTATDLTASQLSELRQNGRMRVSDGPRGISVGDSLDTLLSRLPSTYTEIPTDPDLTGQQSVEEVILYCADYFQNQNGKMTALPPRGLLTVDTGSIIVTLLTPVSAYPAGTKDEYLSYEHIYCVFIINPETMTISAIELGIYQ